jgi:3-methylcrotonyl-CoA carboxylase alpha subunit
LQFPEGEGLRIDTGVVEGDEVTPWYDPMIAKVIAHGRDRNEALDRLAQALRDTVVAGPRTNAGFLLALANAPGFREGAFDTGFIDRHLADLGAVEREPDAASAAAGAAALMGKEVARLARAAVASGAPSRSPWSLDDGFQLSGSRETRLALLVEGERVEAGLRAGAGGLSVALPGAEAMASPAPRMVATKDGILVLSEGRQTAVRLFDHLDRNHEADDSGGLVKSPMHGKVVAVFVVEGESVEKGQRLAVVEAMKMEHVLVARRAGVVAEVAVDAGQQVPEGAKIVVIGDAGA